VPLLSLVSQQLCVQEPLECREVAANKSLNPITNPK
jgi:hypothetical protein